MIIPKMMRIALLRDPRDFFETAYLCIKGSAVMIDIVNAIVKY